MKHHTLVNAGYTAMHNKIHMEVRWEGSTGKPRCGQGRIVDVEFDAIATWTEKAIASVSEQVKASGLDYCRNCFKEMTA